MNIKSKLDYKKCYVQKKCENCLQRIICKDEENDIY